MRQKLEKKKDNTKPEEEETPVTLSSGKADQPTVEKLLEFIEGPQEEPPKLSARAAKRQRRKQRKVCVCCVCIHMHIHVCACVCMCLHACMHVVCEGINIGRYACIYIHMLYLLVCTRPV